LTAEARIRSQLQESHIDLPSIKKLEVKPSKIATLSFHHQGRQEFKIMFKLSSASLIIAAACAFGMAQGPASRDKNEPPSQGVAPKTENGVGRADVRVFDEDGNPIRNAYVKLESTRSDG